MRRYDASPTSDLATAGGIVEEPVVWYPAPLTQSVVQELRALSVGTTIVSGNEPPPNCSVLIEGRPSADQLDACTGLRAVVVPFAGVPTETLSLMRDRPALSLHNLHHNSAETAELAIALMLAACKDLAYMDRRMREHDWTPRYAPSRSIRLEGKHALVVGFGAVGRRIAKVCHAIGMKVTAVRRRALEVKDDGIAVLPVSRLDELLSSADVLLLATPFTPETVGLMSRQRLSLLPKGAMLINVARAQVVDEAALYESLRDGHLHSAGIDVWYQYPTPSKASGADVTSYFIPPESAKCSPPSDFPFHELDNVVMSPHRGGVTSETEHRRVEHLAKLLEAAAEGKPIPNRVDVSAGY